MEPILYGVLGFSAGLAIQLSGRWLERRRALRALRLVRASLPDGEVVAKAAIGDAITRIER